MALSTRQWNTLDSLTTDRARNSAPLERRLGGQRALERLVELGHLKWSGGRLLRTKKSADAFQLYVVIPEDGTPISNANARKAARLTESRYSAAKQLLLATQEIRPGRGRGGSIRRVDYDPGTRAGASEREQDLYEPFKKWLEAQQSSGSPSFQIVKITGTGAGARRRTGQWSKPDVVRIRVIEYVTLPQIDVEVDTFEIKPYAQGKNLIGVFESSAHQRRAHAATLVIEWPFDDDSSLPNAVKSECGRLGVGLIQFWDRNGEVSLEAARQTPSPDLLDGFIQDILTDDELGTYLKAIGRSPEASAQDSLEESE